MSEIAPEMHHEIGTQYRTLNLHTGDLQASPVSRNSAISPILGSVAETATDRMTELIASGDVCW